MAKKPRLRVLRRVGERSLRKLVRDRQRLAELERGGSAERPIEVTSSSVIPLRAEALPCPLCEGGLRLEEETAESVGTRRLRAAHMRCARCGIARTLWFQIGSPLAN